MKLVLGKVSKQTMWNSKQLAMRDPALAAFTGAISGSDFGSNAGFGDEYGYGEDGDDELGFGDDAGYGFGAAAAHPVVARAMTRRPTQQQAAAAWQKLNVKHAIGKSRAMKLDPNADSSIKVERYSFSLADALVIGTASTLTSNMSQSPSTAFRPQVMTANVPAPGFVLATGIAVANVLVAVGGTTDLWNYSAGAWGRDLDLPTLDPSQKLSITGSYTGFIPPGYLAAAAFTLSVSFNGPAVLAGGRALQG
jgi:hypothetical protein